MHQESRHLCAAYSYLISTKQVSFVIHETIRAKVDSIVKTVHAEYFGKKLYPTIESKVAAYFYFLVKDHAFTDGNKRMAVLWAETYSEINGVTINLPSGIGLDMLAVYVEEIKLAHADVIHLIEKILFNSSDM
jgi:death-on-curing protein